MEQLDIAAIIVASLSAVVSISLGYNTRQHNEKLQKLTKQHNEDIEKLKIKLQKARDEEAALRDYEYDAKKRLYQEFEPLLFLLVEYSESSRFRIRNFLKNAKTFC